MLLSGAELTLVYGKRYGLVGRNGIGKTTLLKMISRFQFFIPFFFNFYLKQATHHSLKHHIFECGTRSWGRWHPRNRSSTCIRHKTSSAADGWAWIASKTEQVWQADWMGHEFEPHLGKTIFNNVILYWFIQSWYTGWTKKCIVGSTGCSLRGTTKFATG